MSDYEIRLHWVIGDVESPEEALRVFLRTVEDLGLSLWDFAVVDVETGHKVVIDALDMKRKWEGQDV